MINLKIKITKDGKEVDTICTMFNGTIEEARNHYNTNGFFDGNIYTVTEIK